MIPPDTDLAPARPARHGTTAFDPLAAVDDLLSDVGLSATEAGGIVAFAGQDPIVPARHRLGACIAVPMMASAVAAVALHRRRGGPPQDLELDLRQAVHGTNPAAFWHPTLNGERAPHPLVLDNPFLVVPYRTADGRWVMACGVYPHLAARWCRFLDVPPDMERVAATVAGWGALQLEDAANASGLPATVVRTADEWLAHEHGALLARQPVIGLERIGDAGARDAGLAERPLAGIRVLSFTHAVAGPTVGRTLAEHGADVALRHATERLRARVHLCRGERGSVVPTSTSRVRPGRNERPGCWRTPTSWSTTTAAASWSATASTPAPSRNGIRASSTCRSPVTGPVARGRGAEVLT